MGQVESTQDPASERLTTLRADGLQDSKKRPKNPDEDEIDAADTDGKTQEVDRAVANVETGSRPRKSPRQTILKRTADWIAQCPKCFSEYFVFFYSANFARGYNSKNAWLAQAGPAAICIDGINYQSPYHYYYLERAGVVKRFNLKRKHQLYGTFGEGIDAKNLALVVRDGKINAKDMKNLVYDFIWTDEAIEAWDQQALFVLYKANFYKFTRHQNLYDKLMATGTKYIIKACPQKCDCTCGIRFEFMTAMEHRSEWRANLLGKTLMRLRDDLKTVDLPLDAQHPTQEQLAAVPSIRYIDDGRTHECEQCRGLQKQS